MDAGCRQHVFCLLAINGAERNELYRLFRQPRQCLFRVLPNTTPERSDPRIESSCRFLDESSFFQLRQTVVDLGRTHTVR